MKNKTDRILDNLEKIISVLFVSLLGMISYFFVNLEELTIIKLRTFNYWICHSYWFNRYAMCGICKIFQ